MAAPWCSVNYFAASLGVLGALGVVYSVNTVWHARNSSYKPDFSDWIWYTALPLTSHLILVAAAILAWFGFGWSLTLIAVDSVTLLLLGIHNSWDTVTYIALNHSKSPGSSD
jgi:hypothetical protein